MNGAILGRMRKASGLVVVAFLLHACSDIAPKPSPPAPIISPTEPRTLALGTAVGMGADAGHATVTARIQNSVGAPLADVIVRFTTDVGALSVASIATGADGMATTALTATATATVTATAGGLTSKTLVASQPIVAAPPPPPAPDPPPDPAAPSISLVTLTAQVGMQSVLQANARLNGVQAASYSWTFGDGSTFQGKSAAAAHTYTALGTFATGVTVVDTLGRSASASGTATVGPVPPPPPPPPPPAPSYSVVVSALPATVLLGGSSTLTATVTAQNGAPTATSYAWDCDGNGTPETTTGSNTTVCNYPVAGSISSKVTVSGGAVSSLGSVVVTSSTAIPTITVTCNTVTFPAMTTCGVSATIGGSQIPAGSITSVTWDWGDSLGTTTTAGNIGTRNYAAALPAYHVVATATVTGATGPGVGAGTAIVN